MSAAAPLDYRPDIDGLRAVAVLPVVVFHAAITLGEERLLAGGYVGVDVFFVISGYLITGLLLREHAAGQFKLAHFYERRARRILPALLLVTFSCLPFGWAWFDAAQLEALGGGLAAVALFASNLLFWQRSDYFAPAAESNPLLHTWSLAVEEQFYLLFPLLLWLLWRLWRERGWVALAILAALSLAVAQWTLRESPAAAFYLAHTRAWELLAGGLAAWLEWRRGRPAPGYASSLAPGAGLVAILAACLLYDEHSGVPGVAALLPAGGALLVIRYGGGQDLASRVLTSRPLVALGLISYSLYLWHQPVLVFARTAAPGDLSPLHMTGLLLLSLCLAWLSYRWVERPFRDRAFLRPASIAGLSFGGSLLLAAAGLALVASAGVPQRLPPLVEALGQYRKYPYQQMMRDRACLLHPDQGYADFADECFANADQRTVLWGDSHAAALSSALAERLGDGQLSQLTTASCPPVIGLKLKGVPRCEAINAEILGLIRERPPVALLLHAFWNVYRPVEGTGLAHNSDDYFELLDSTLQSLSETGVPVTVLGSLPVWYPSLPERLQRYVRVRGALPDVLPRPARPRLDALDARIARLAERNGHRFVSLTDAVCGPSGCQVTLPPGNGTPLLVQWDASHPTREGAALILERALGPLDR
jgi:peptidoglycan/LPS O-acetylase OafA/YrhL